jgi:methionyl-tRNA formyltransferase
MTMRIVFMGTPDFAVPTLRALLDAGQDIVAVYTQPPRTAGRGMALRPSPVQQEAARAGLAVRAPASLKSPDEQASFRALHADAAVVVAYGLILPRFILDATRHGAFNVHASLLPRWRGAAPINRAVMAGDTETGISIMRITEGLDAGPVCLEGRLPIGRDETAGELHDRLANLGAGLIVEALAKLEAGALECAAQPDAGMTYAEKISPDETRIDWTQPAPKVHDMIRGLSPSPGAWFELELAGRTERVRALRTTFVELSGTPGAVLDDHLTIACGEGAVRLTELQRAGKRPMPAEEFLRGVKLGPGMAVS